MSKSSIRRAITSLKNSKVISDIFLVDNKAIVEIVVDDELIQKKKSTKITHKKSLNHKK